MCLIPDKPAPPIPTPFPVLLMVSHIVITAARYLHLRIRLLFATILISRSILAALILMVMSLLMHFAMQKEAVPLPTGNLIHLLHPPTILLIIRLGTPAILHWVPGLK